ncbi:DUF2931 family protein [Bacteroides oleiciplenus]|uniref:DUF2931 family protein n=1 Tax=Bacteroides oleiciplenus TaxID=626931 RepID=A0A3E5BKM1_9BACE|nr:DUF2931 family protein [Bacteroides oleiciplenus]RGN38150.1 DUF2931 family protein [Bacteroides oleiciplenus]
MKILFIVMGILSLFSSCSGKKEKQQEKEGLYKWRPSESAPYLYPTTIHVGYFGMPDKSTVYIPSKSIVGNSWGLGQSWHVVGEDYKPLPEAIEIVWLSFTENKFYFVSEWLPKEKLKSLFDEVWINYQGNECRYDALVVGMAPYGMIQIWAAGDARRTEVCCLHGAKVSVPMSEFRPNAVISQDEYVKKIQKYPRIMENLKNNGLPDSLLYENYRKRFDYHIVPQIEMENADLKSIVITYFNGEYDNILWERLEENSCSMQARPRKIDVGWNVGEDGYFARILFDEQAILSLFEKAFGSDYPQRDDFDIVELYEQLYGEGKLPKGDLIIHIDSEGKPTGVSIKTNKEELDISTDKIQVVAFKNDKFLWKSSNYDKRDWWLD